MIEAKTYLPPCVAENDSLSDCQCIVEIAECIEFPVFLLHSNEELLDTLKRQLITLDENANGVCHELRCHLQNIIGQRGAEKDDLSCGGKVSVDIVNLVLEPLVQEFVCLVKHEHLDVACPQATAPNHVENTPWCSGNYVLPVLQLADILPDGRAANTCVALHVHVVTQGEHNRLDLCCKFTRGAKDQSLCLADSHVDRLEDGDRECRGLSRSGLSLGDDVPSLDDGKNSSLLNSRGFFEVFYASENARMALVWILTVSVDATQQVLLQTEVVEGRHDRDRL